MNTQQRFNKPKDKKTRAHPATRKQPGSTGKGDYYHIEVRPAGDFDAFQTQAVSKRGNIQRVAGRRASGYWSTVKWLIGKEDAHVSDRKLIPDTMGAREVFEQLGSKPLHVIGDRFKARPRGRFSENAKRTSAQLRIVRKNLNAQTARTKKN